MITTIVSCNILGLEFGKPGPVGLAFFLNNKYADAKAVECSSKQIQR